MTQDPLGPDTPPHQNHGTAQPAGSPGSGPTGPGRRASRTGVLWAATVVALVLLILLIIFIAQNQHTVPLHYFAFDGTVSLGLALFIAAVVGGVLVAIVGAARIIQLRLQARSEQHRKR
jgi:uncharacterized integral membrane protein